VAQPLAREAESRVPQGRDLTTLAAARARWEATETERAAFLAGSPSGAWTRRCGAAKYRWGIRAHFHEMFSPRGRSFDLSPGTTRHAAATGGRDAAGDGADRVLPRASRGPARNKLNHRDLPIRP